MTPRITPTDHTPTLAEGVPIDPLQLLLGRLLLQANSGAGKSRTVRRLLEQTFGIYQQIVIDVEGEFSTLREKYDYILFGPGGDYPVSVESAGLLAHRLLETGVSAVIDIYELGTRKAEWVKSFLEALVAAPKELWHPVIVVLDEAHKFCLDEDTELLTRTGWKRHTDIVCGETEAVGFNLANGTYHFETVSDVIRRRHAGPMTVLKSDGIDCHVTPDHRVVLRRQQRAHGRARLYDWTFCQALSVPHHVHVPIGGAPVGDGVELSEDMIRLIGWVVTDGCFTGGDAKRYLGISQSTATRKRGRSMIAEFDAVLKRLGTKGRYERPARTSGAKVSAPSVDYYLGKTLSAKVLAWTGLDIHRVPRRLIDECTRAQLEVLMLGLLEGDGTARDQHWTVFYPGHNEALADDFQEIAVRLGISTSKRRVPQSGQWIVRISRRPHHYVRRPSTADYDGVVWCITLPSGAFVVRRHGKIFVTGNCPEKGEDIAASTAAVLDLMTLGRKRGFCGWLATQRVAKLHKTATSECNNKLIGRTGQDDIARAGKELGLRGDAAQVLRKLRPGQFYVYGPAISDDVQLVTIGPIQTTHPEAGQQVPPAAPPRAKIRAVFGEFANIATEAAKEIKTTEDLRAKIDELQRRLGATTDEAAHAKYVELAKEHSDLKVQYEDVKMKWHLALNATEKHRNAFREYAATWGYAGAVAQADEQIRKVKGVAGEPQPDRTQPFMDVVNHIAKHGPVIDDQEPPPARVPSKPDRREDRRRQDDTTKQRIADQMRPTAVAGDRPSPSTMARALLAVLAQRGEPMHRSALLLRAGYVTGGTTNSAIAQILADGWAEPTGPSEVIITSRGRAVLGPYTAPPTGHELRARDLAKLKTMQRKFLSVLFDLYPRPVARKDLYARAGYVAGGTVNNAVAILIRNNRVVSPRQGELMASEEYYR